MCRRPLRGEKSLGDTIRRIRGHLQKILYKKGHKFKKRKNEESTTSNSPNTLLLKICLKKLFKLIIRDSHTSPTPMISQFILQVSIAQKNPHQHLQIPSGKVLLTQN
jgi:hypothetical protein